MCPTPYAPSQVTTQLRACGVSSRPATPVREVAGMLARFRDPLSLAALVLMVGGISLISAGLLTWAR